MRRRIAILALVLIALIAFTTLVSPARDLVAAPHSDEERQRALHVLNRLGFGPGPGDVERVLAIGIDRYVEQQLHPERIAERDLERDLKSRFPTLTKSTDALFAEYVKPVLEARRENRRASRNNDEEEPSRMMRISPDKRPRRVVEDLMRARIIRAVESDRQLHEVMVDFWMNHFNVAANKGVQSSVLVTSYERDVIRPNIWGRFDELLLATAKSPAMLLYLDNARSVAEMTNRPEQMARRQPQRARNAGLNENYARELMELHTLGVDGGYTQKDVTELARVLTGWSVNRPEDGTIQFIFRRAMHDTGTKQVLGTTFTGGGMEEGERAIRMLARHPSTAKFLSKKLCQRLVADEPPQQLVDRVAKRFLETGGDLRATVKAVVTSPEFNDPRYYRGKVKTPFEYVVSSIRAVGGKTDGRSPAQVLVQMGQGLYLCQPPTGYSDLAEPWVNTGALVARLNFSLALSSGKVPGTSVSAAEVFRGDGDLVRQAASALTGGTITPETRKTIDQRLATTANLSATEKKSLVAALILGSPEFQRQ